MRPKPGDIIGGKYRIVRMIGDGGMGAVYEARHEILGTSVALKFLHAELAKRQGLSSRFLQEARVSASIQSPHVTKVTDVDQTPEGSPYLVMELLSGDSLQQLLDRSRKLAKDQAIDFTLQVLSGLEAAHALGVVHRDLKPDNVFITPSPGGPVCKLLDFGIAKLRQSNEYGRGLTRPGALMGTPEYMSPEQLYSADRVDHRADLYSLGVMLFEMLCGERPTHGEDAAAIVGNVMAGKIRRLDEIDPSLPKDLVAVVHKAIAPDKSQRYQSALDMRMALAPFAGHLSHAGRLAATPVPAGTSAPPPAVEKKDKTTEEPPHPGAAAKPGGVAPTLPPDDAAPAQTADNPPAPTGGNPPTVGSPPLTDVGPRGSTQEASKDLVEQLAAQHAAAQAVPPAQRSSPAASPSPYGPPPGAASPAATPYGQFGPPAARPKRSGVGAIIALLTGLVLTASIIGVVVWMRQSREDGGPQPLSTLGGTAPNTTISAQGGPTDIQPPPGPGPGPVDTPPPGPGPKPTGTVGTKPKSDAGADGGAKDAGQASPWPFPIPSGMPPLPSALPFPTFPLPGFGPPPANSK
jgi:serine/threonine protein kinase